MISNNYLGLLYPAYVISTLYTVGQIVSYNNLPYRKLSAAAAGTTPKVGPDWEIYYPGLVQSTSFYDTDNYTDYYGQTRLNKTNIKLKPSVRMNGQTTASYIPFLTDSLDVYPLFERLGRLTEKNNPTLFNPTSPLTGITYNATSLYLGYKYSVNRGVLYKFIGDTPISTYPDQPYADSTNWTERDFCLVNNFKFYKDRTRVTVFEASIESLTDSVKNSLYFYRPNLILKNGFTNRSFSGSTINNKLITALDKFYDITDTNRRTPTQNGLVDFRVSGNDVIMDYIPEKDEIGYPLTGEFIGKLRFSNPCGQTATTFFGILFDTDVTLLDRQQGLTQTANFAPEVAEILPYVVRVVVTQSGEANATLTIKQVNSSFEQTTTSKTVARNTVSDDRFDVIPETDFEISVTYSTQRNQTKFGSAFVDGTPLFVNNQDINTNTIQTNYSLNRFIETRTVKLKNVTANRTIFINLDGILSVTDVRTDVATPQATFNIRSINVNTALL
jgi:hypothetical protein